RQGALGGHAGVDLAPRHQRAGDRGGAGARPEPGQPRDAGEVAMAWDLSRRVFLKGLGFAAVGVGFSPSSLMVRAAEGADAGSRVFVHVFLRGGADGLALVPPVGDSDYGALRGAIALGR